MDGFANVYIGTICFVIVNAEEGSISGSQAGLILSSSLLLIGVFQYGIKLTADFETQMISTERVLEYGDLDQEKDDKECNVLSDDWPEKGSIIFDQITLSYNHNSNQVLKNISFKINPRDRIGIVGRTGAGKSSLITVLFRLVEPNAGRIIIDGIDTQNISLHQLRKNISIIPQDPTLFSGTIRSNLDPFSVYDDNQLWKSLKASNLDHIINCMPDKLDSIITEGGSNFSVGQRQLLCLSRALLKNNRILVLDEATANVDRETDDIIQGMIRNNFTNCTTLTIAHRLNTVIDMDLILVLEAGQVIEFDSPNNLLQNHKGYFYSMVQQAGIELK